MLGSWSLVWVMDQFHLRLNQLGAALVVIVVVVDGAEGEGDASSCQGEIDTHIGADVRRAA